MDVRAMVEADIAGAMAFWRSFDGVQLNEGDDAEGLVVFLRRNPGLSFVAWDGERMIGAVLAGHDGRRGFLYHLAVDAEFRGRGIGSELVARTLTSLRQVGIVKCHVMVFRNNDGGNAFWSQLRWRRRDDLFLHTVVVEG